MPGKMGVRKTYLVIWEGQDTAIEDLNEVTVVDPCIDNYALEQKGQGDMNILAWRPLIQNDLVNGIFERNETAFMRIRMLMDNR